MRRKKPLISTSILSGGLVRPFRTLLAVHAEVEVDRKDTCFSNSIVIIPYSVLVPDP